MRSDDDLTIRTGGRAQVHDLTGDCADFVRARTTVC